MPRRSASRMMSRWSDDRLALEVAFPWHRRRLPARAEARWHSILSLRMNSFVGFSNNPVGLIAELRGELAGELPITSAGVTNFLFCRGCCGRRSCAASGPLKPLLAIACSICWRRGLEASSNSSEYPLISGAPFSLLDFNSRDAKPKGQFRLINSGWQTAGCRKDFSLDSAC